MRKLISINIHLNTKSIFIYFIHENRYWLTLCILVKFSWFFAICYFFLENDHFLGILSEIRPECWTVWILIRPDLGPNCWPKSSVDGTSTMQTGLILCMLHNSSCMCCHLLTLFKIDFFNKKKIQEHYPSFKWFESRSGLAFCQSWSGSELFAKVISSWQKSRLAATKNNELLKTGGCQCEKGAWTLHWV